MSEENDRLQRNEILKNKTEQPQPMLSQPVQALKSPGGMANSQQSMELELPAGDVRIPTRGLIYPEGHPLHQVELVPVRGILTSDEDILMNQALVKRGGDVVIQKLLEACILDKNISVESLTLGDKDAILVYIRALGYGSYDVKVNCPKCSVASEQSVDLGGLEVKEIDLDRLHQVRPFSNEFEFVLPMTKKVVTFKYPTVKDAADMAASIAAKKKRGLPVDRPVTNKLLQCITSVEGNTDKAFISRFVQNIPGKDSLALSKHMDGNEPSVEMVFEFQCSDGECGHTEVLDIPLGVGFLWPSLL